MKYLFLLVVALSSCLLLSFASQGLQERKENTISKQVEWELLPLVGIDTEVPDKGGSRFQEFGQAFWLSSGVVVFWGRFGKDNNDWGLYSLKNGNLKTVLVEGEDVTSPNFLTIADRKPEKLRLHQYSHEAKWSTGWHVKTPIHRGRELLYLSIDKSNTNVGLWAGDNSTVYAWDGEHLKGILGKGDDLEVSGIRYKVASATVLTISTQGEALIYYKTKSPRETNGWVLHNGTTLTPLLASGNPLPGMQGVQILDSAIGRNFFLDWKRKSLSTTWLSPDAAVAVLRVTGAPYKKALFRLTKEKAEKIIAEGDSDPSDPKKFVKEITKIEVADPNTMAILVNRSTSTSDYALMLYHQGQLRRIFEITLVVRDPGWNELELGDLEFIQADPPQLVFEAIVSKSFSRITSDYRSWTITSYKALRPEVCLYDGERVSILAKDTNMFYIDFHRVSGSYTGIIIGGWPLDGAQDTRSKPSMPLRYWFLDFSAKGSHLVPAPEFPTGDARRVSLADVVAWKAPNEAIIQQQDGFYSLIKR